MKPQAIRTRPVPDCPECFAPMVLRRPKPHDNWEPFWGCSDYPHCRGVRQIRSDGTPEEDDDWLDEL